MEAWVGVASPGRWEERRGGGIAGRFRASSKKPVQKRRAQEQEKREA